MSDHTPESITHVVIQGEALPIILKFHDTVAVLASLEFPIMSPTILPTPDLDGMVLYLIPVASCRFITYREYMDDFGGDAEVGGLDQLL